ncbi:unnamed protein product [Lactuca virosa]|uniref:Uncharacterized protein n=1 Tax=Lactuca virosa TaxID=75947 RepID=A0AAU9P0V2_9ASTR|nr:unnamed protein product [Lactuca virosa]
MVQPRSPCQILLIIVLCTALCWRPLMSSMLETADGPMTVDNRETTDPKDYYCCKSFDRSSCNPQVCNNDCTNKGCAGGICKKEGTLKCHCRC